jgi:hypothetical protein
MQIGSRFAEYGLTGGLFWLCELCLLGTSRTGADLWARVTATQLSIPPGTSDIFVTVVSSLAGALAIVAVFVAGLALDMLAASSLQIEMRLFKKHLDRNDKWIAPLLARYGVYCLADYTAIRDNFGEVSHWRGIKSEFDVFVFWNRERRQRYINTLKEGLGRWRLVRSYERLWSFLSSYVMVLSGSPQLALWTDQYYLWRTGRAVSVALLIVFLQAQLMGVFFTLSLSFDSFLLGLTLGTLLPLLILSLAIAITSATYSRLCYTLFSLVYVIQEKIASTR